MSYANVETTMQSVLATVTNLSSATVTKGDDAILDRGVTHCAVIEPGSLLSGFALGKVVDDTWVCNVTIYVKFTTKVATHAAFVTLRDNVVAKLQTYFPDIGNNANNPYQLSVTGISSSGDPQDIAMRNNPDSGPVFRSQTLSVAVAEMVIL